MGAFFFFNFLFFFSSPLFFQIIYFTSKHKQFLINRRMYKTASISNILKMDKLIHSTLSLFDLWRQTTNELRDRSISQILKILPVNFSGENCLRILQNSYKLLVWKGWYLGEILLEFQAELLVISDWHTLNFFFWNIDHYFEISTKWDG